MESIYKGYKVTKQRVAKYIESLESTYKSREDFKVDIINMMNSELVKTDKYQLRFYNAVIDQLSVKNEMDIPKHEIQLVAWFKNNEEWYYPFDFKGLHLDDWEHYEIIQYYNPRNFLVFCWNGSKRYNNSRLYKAKIKF